MYHLHTDYERNIRYLSETYHLFAPMQLDPAPAIAGIGLSAGNRFPLSAKDNIIFPRSCY